MVIDSLQGFFLPLLCLFFFCFSNSVYSRICAPGELTTTPSVGFYYVAGINSYKYPSPSIACSSAASIDKFWGDGYTGSGSGTGPTACTVTKTSTGTTFLQASITFSAGTCPTGFVLDGSICRNTCTPEEPCPSAGTEKKATVALSGISGEQGIGVSMCVESGTSNCNMTCSSGIASYNDVTGQSSVYCESYTFTGTNCTDTSKTASPVTSVPTQNQATPLNNPPKSKEDCPGGSGFATVNNVGMCLPSGTKYTDASSTTTTQGGGSVTTTSTTTTNNNGTTSTTTVNTYKDASGNVTYSGTTTGTSSLNQNGTTGGQGDNKPPNLGNAPTFDSTLPQESTFNIKAQSNPVFSTQIFQSSATCPPDITYSVLGRDLSISFSSICAFADVIRGIILMLSALVSMRVVVSQ